MKNVVSPPRTSHVSMMLGGAKLSPGQRSVVSIGSAIGGRFFVNRALVAGATDEVFIYSDRLVEPVPINIVLSGETYGLAQRDLFARRVLEPDETVDFDVENRGKVEVDFKIALMVTVVVDEPKVISPCGNCGEDVLDHCKVHLIPCCPGRCQGKARPRPGVFREELAFRRADVLGDWYVIERRVSGTGEPFESRRFGDAAVEGTLGEMRVLAEVIKLGEGRQSFPRCAAVTAEGGVLIYSPSNSEEYTMVARDVAERLADEILAVYASSGLPDYVGEHSKRGKT